MDILGCVEESTQNRVNTDQKQQNHLFAEPITFQQAFAPHFLHRQPDDVSVGVEFVAGRPGNAAGYQTCLATSERLTVIAQYLLFFPAPSYIVPPMSNTKYQGVI